MDLKCNNCGHVGDKVDFRFLNHADSAGVECFRQCPKCHAAVFSEEMEELEAYCGGTVWGTSKLRGRVFTRPRPPKDTEQER